MGASLRTHQIQALAGIALSLNWRGLEQAQRGLARRQASRPAGIERHLHHKPSQFVDGDAVLDRAVQVHL